MVKAFAAVNGPIMDQWNRAFSPMVTVPWINSPRHIREDDDDRL